MSQDICRTQVSASFSYFKPSPIWKSVKPYFIYVPKAALPEGQQTTNEESVSISGVQVTDIRSVQPRFDLDECGFTVIDKNLAEYQDDAFYKGELSKSMYSLAIKEMVLKILGAESVIILATALRARDKTFPQRTWGTSERNQPIQGVHIDTTPRDARNRLKSSLGEKEAGRLAGRRIQVINTWHPLFGPLRDWPLALLDFRSVDTRKDILARDAVFPHTVSESFQVFHNENHRWYYMSDQQPNEVLLFKSYDSRPDVATFCPHAAFDLGQKDQRLRESVNMLMLVIYGEDEQK